MLLARRRRLFGGRAARSQGALRRPSVFQPSRVRPRDAHRGGGRRGRHDRLGLRPNGGKDYAAKLRFLESLEGYARAAKEAGREILLCGDLNVARTDQDVHPKERKAGAIGQREDERALFEGILAQGLVDVGRTLDPDNEGLFTWWAPWRNLRQRKIGWRIDYVLASASLARRATACAVRADVGTSDHAPIVADFSPA